MEGPVPAAGSKIPDGKAQSLFYVFLLCFRGMEAGDDALHLFLGPAPSIKYHISDILDHCHPSIRFPTMVRGSYQSTVRGGFGSGKWKHEIRFARLLLIVFPIHTGGRNASLKCKIDFVLSKPVATSI